jgi:hypothetical protein
MAVTGLYPGLTERDIAEALDNALRAAGMEPFFDIVLFGLSKPKIMLGFNSQANTAQMKTHLILTGAPMVPKCWSPRHLSSLMSGTCYLLNYPTSIETHVTVGHISMATRRIFAALSSLHSWKNRPRGRSSLPAWRRSSRSVFSWPRLAWLSNLHLGVGYRV